jgi:hypothetical protein
MLIYIVILHVFTIVCVLGFDIPLLMCTVVILMTLVALAWSIKAWLYQQRYSLKYESTYKCWSMSAADVKQWQQYESVRVVYLNDTLVWIILGSPYSGTKAAIIGVDSMPNERFLQLRRCILCPDMFDQ